MFENDVLPFGPSVPRPELAMALGISVDRVGRLAARATQRISAAFDQAPPLIKELAATVTERLGAAAPLIAVNEALGRTIAPWTLPPDSPNLRMLAATVDERQREAYLAPYVRGETISAIGISEPGAGSDPAGMKTIAMRDGDDWVLNGRKIWITKADRADFTIVIAVTDKEKRQRFSRPADIGMIIRNFCFMRGVIVRAAADRILISPAFTISRSEIDVVVATLREVMDSLREHVGRAHVLGITGPPGVGKSTSTNALVTALRTAGKRVGVLAIDPSSPFSGGALLGDRVRMADHAVDPGVYIRSMGSRGHLGGLALHHKGRPLPPLGQVGIRVTRAGLHGGTVDGLLEPFGKLALGAPTPRSDDHLGRNVAPVDDGDVGHGDPRGSPARLTSGYDARAVGYRHGAPVLRLEVRRGDDSCACVAVPATLVST